eukprot:135549_1
MMLLMLVSLLSNHAVAQWIKSNNTLGRVNWGLAVGHYNQSIYLSGGWYRGNAYEYDIEQNILTANTIPNFDLYGYGQHYTQIDSLLYVMGDKVGHPRIYVLDMQSKSLPDPYIIDIP